MCLPNSTRLLEPRLNVRLTERHRILLHVTQATSSIVVGLDRVPIAAAPSASSYNLSYSFRLPLERLTEGRLHYCKRSGMQQSGLNMDIRKWLAATENSVLSEQPKAEHCLLSRQPDTVPDARQRRKRGSSDSSLLKAHSPRLRRKSVSVDERDRFGVPDAIDESHSDASRPGSTESAASSVVSQRYARKPRRKTRADKYDIGSKRTKKRSDDQRPSRKSESRKSKRKSRRQKGNKTHNGIGHDFQASNVSKDRLTVSVLHTTVY